MKFDSNKRNCNLLIVDELHHCLNKDSKYFSNLLECKTDYKIGLSASLSAKHLTFLKNNNFTYVFDLPITIGSYLELVPNYKIYNISCNFSTTDKINYIKEQEVIDKLIDTFSPILLNLQGDEEYNLDKLLSLVLLSKGKKGYFLNKSLTAEQWLIYIYNELLRVNVNIKQPEVIIYIAKKLKLAMINREKIITECKNKNLLVIDILSKLKRSKSIIFTKSKEISILLEKQLLNIDIKSKVYNSDVTDKNKKLILEAYLHNYINSLICINELKEGFDVANIDLIIRHSFNGTQIDAQQILGRAVRFDKNNENKFALVINIYINNFTYNNIKYIVPDTHKLEYAYNGLNVEWIDNIEQINKSKNEI